MAKAPADLRSLARAHTQLAIDTLSGIARNGKNETARAQASNYLLDRGWGKPKQEHTGPGGGPLQFVAANIDLSKATDEQLRSLEAIFGPLATSESDDGGDTPGEGEAES